MRYTKRVLLQILVYNLDADYWWCFRGRVYYCLFIIKTETIYQKGRREARGISNHRAQR
jgi:hypothetical protein